MKRFALAAVVLAGCALGPDYRRPSTPMSATFRGETRADPASFADLPWWQAFDDPVLIALIREGLEHSYDLQDAVARVEAAREAAGIAADALLPSIGAQAGVSYQQIFSPFATGSSGNPHFAAYQIVGSISWEMDLWGRLRRLKESALADYLATEDARRGVVVSLIGAIAQGYFTLLALDLQRDIARRTVQSRAKTLDLFVELERGGTGNRLQTASEEANLADAAARIPELERQTVAAENQVSILLGRLPGPIARPTGLFQRSAPPTRPAGIPGALLERRPDVRQAEARMVSANAQVGAAYAARLPALTWGLNGGFESSALDSLFTSGGVTYGVNVLGSWLAPILNGRQLTHRYRAQEANWRSAVAQYRGTVLNALAEVSNALVAIDTLRDVRVQLETEVAARAESVKLARDRFVNGVSSYLDVVQAEQNLLPAELALAQAIGAQFVAQTQLYRALGGGWAIPGVTPSGAPREP